MSNKRTKSHTKGHLKRAKPRKAGLEPSVKRAFQTQCQEMDTSSAIWEAHDDPC